MWVFSSLAVWKPGEEDHVEDEDESTGAEDRDDDGQDDVQLPVLLFLQAEPWLKVRVYNVTGTPLGINWILGWVY